MMRVTTTVALLGAAAVSALDLSMMSPNVELALDPRRLLSAPAVSTYDDLLARRLETLAASDAEPRDQALTLFKFYKSLNPKQVAAMGTSESAQFEAFYETTFPQIMARAKATATSPSPATTTTTPASTTTNPEPSTKAPSSTTKAPSKPIKYSVVKTTNVTQVADSLSFFSEVYNETLASKIRALQDNTQVIEPIVQSTKTDTSKDSTSQFQAPIVLESVDDGPISLDDDDDGRRRLADGTNGSSPLVQVLFCDVTGNAIWKWSHTPYDANTPINKTTTNVNVNTPTKLCEAPTVEVKVTAYQSGCSRQNHPEGCDNVYWKGCGGLTVNRNSDRVIVARTGGRSLGMLYYKSLGNTCQGRVVDAITHYKGKRFNSISHAEYSPAGNLYFTDSPFGLATKPEDFDGDTLDKSPLRELPFNGVFLLKNNSMKLDLVECAMDRPNKIAFSPKGDIMYITNSRKGNSYIKQFNLNADGMVNSTSTFFNFTAHPELETDDGYADGIKTDDQGNVYVAAHNGVFIFSPSGDLIGNMRGSQTLSGIALGGGRMFLTGSFGIVAQATGVAPALPIPSAKTDCA